MKRFFSKQKISWYLWDFGTQILLVNASVYFVEWLVLDNKVPDFWYSLAFIISTVVLIFVSPYFGLKLDERGGRKKTFLLLTAGTLLSGGLITWAAHIGGLALRVATALTLFALLNFFFQLASVVFNTFLKDISEPEELGRVAGLGSGFSTVGDTVGLLITLPIVLGAVTVFGASRASVFAPAAALALLFCLPFYFAFRHHRDAPMNLAPQGNRLSRIWRDVRDSERYPGVGRLLLAYCLYNDAILTLQLFAPVYLDKVYHLPDVQKVAVIIVVYLSFTLGAWGGGYIGDRRGNRPSLLAGLLATGTVIALIAAGVRGAAMYVLFSLFGIGTGVAFSNTKALFTKLVPYEKKAQFFGVYAIFERFASIVGPLAWGAVTYLVSSHNAVNYRAAALTMSLFLFVGALIARKVFEPAAA